MLRKFAACLLLCLFAQTAWAMDLEDANTGPYDNIHKVALISAVGRFRTHGFNGEKEIDIADWQLDEKIAMQVRKYLGARFEIVDIPFDRNVMLNLPTRMSREGRAAAYLKTLQNPGVDAFLMVRPAQESGMPGPEGIALSIIDRGTALWANFEIDIVDAHNWKFIGKAQARIQDDSNAKPAYPAFAHVGFWDGKGDLTDAQKAKLHRQTDELVPRAVVETLRALKLEVPLPPPGDPSIAPSAIATDMRGIQNVAVVSALADRIELQVYGSSILEKGGITPAPTADWGMDEDIEKAVTQAISPSFTVKPPPLDHKSWQALVNGAGPDPALPAGAADGGVDAYILVYKAKLPFYNEKDDATGLGFYTFTSIYGRTVLLYDQYAVAVLDAKSGRLLNDVAFLKAAEVGEKTNVVDNNLWPEKGAAATSPDWKARVHAKMMAVLIPELLKALRKMTLSVAQN